MLYRLIIINSIGSAVIEIW